MRPDADVERGPPVRAIARHWRRTLGLQFAFLGVAILFFALIENAPRLGIQPRWLSALFALALGGFYLHAMLVAALPEEARDRARPERRPGRAFAAVLAATMLGVVAIRLVPALNLNPVVGIFVFVIERALLLDLGIAVGLALLGPWLVRGADPLRTVQRQSAGRLLLSLFVAALVVSVIQLAVLSAGYALVWMLGGGGLMAVSQILLLRILPGLQAYLGLLGYLAAAVILLRAQARP